MYSASASRSVRERCGNDGIVLDGRTELGSLMKRISHCGFGRFTNSRFRFGPPVPVNWSRVWQPLQPSRVKMRSPSDANSTRIGCNAPDGSSIGTATGSWLPNGDAIAPAQRTPAVAKNPMNSVKIVPDE